MIQSSYFELRADPQAFPRWYLGSPFDKTGSRIDPRLFTQGKIVGKMPPITVPLRRHGPPVEFNFCDFDMIVTSRRVASALAAFAADVMERFPVDVEGSTGDFEIVNVADTVDCIDEDRSEFLKWSTEDGRPDKVGAFRMFTRLRINAAAVGNRQLFRVARWPIALIASREVRILLERMNVTGITFEQIS